MNKAFISKRLNKFNYNISWHEKKFRNKCSIFYKKIEKLFMYAHTHPHAHAHTHIHTHIHTVPHASRTDSLKLKEI